MTKSKSQNLPKVVAASNKMLLETSGAAAEASKRIPPSLIRTDAAWQADMKRRREMESFMEGRNMDAERRLEPSEANRAYIAALLARIKRNSQR